MTSTTAPRAWRFTATAPSRAVGANATIIKVTKVIAST